MKKQFPALGLMALSLCCGCQKVVHINLNDSSPRYVIEANVTDDAGPYLVHITRSKNFEEDNTFAGVSGMFVMIRDATSGVSDTLTEMGAGTYQTHALRGISGHTYQLLVQNGSTVFTASSTMPGRVSLDSLYVEKSSFGKSHRITPVYTDPAGVTNYYHFRQFQNDSETGEIFIRNDLLTDGQRVAQSLGGADVQSGDSMTVFMQCVDSAVYQYYYTLRQTMDQNSGTPANPISNIQGGALGYFNACTQDMKILIVP